MNDTVPVDEYMLEAIIPYEDCNEHDNAFDFPDLDQFSDDDDDGRGIDDFYRFGFALDGMQLGNAILNDIFGHY